MAKEKKPIYKRTWFIVLIVLIAFSVIYSMGQDDTNNSDNNSNNSNDKVVQTADKPGDNDNQNASISDPEPEPEPTSQTWKSGTHKVGTDIPSGEYVVISDDRLFGGYLEVAVDSTGSLESIVTNEIVTTNHIITIEDGQFFKLERLIAYKFEESPELDTSKEGMFKAGYHIDPGEYKIIVDDTDLGAYYAVFSDSKGGLHSIVTNNIITGDSYITVAEGQYILIQRGHLE
ncbi:MAG: hypothetical protein GX778_02725 [Erysipelothrix sp.]|nr:hypothetical protein [Erysipelothrix sp.]